MFSKMDSSDSDDDVYFGPYTLEEAKSDCKRNCSRLKKESRLMQKFISNNQSEEAELLRSTSELDINNEKYFSSSGRQSADLPGNTDFIKQCNEITDSVDTTTSSYQTARTGLTSNVDNSVNESSSYLQNNYLSLLGDIENNEKVEDEKTIANLGDKGSPGLDSSDEKENLNLSDQSEAGNAFEFNDTLDEINRFLLENEDTTTPSLNHSPLSSIEAPQTPQSKIPLYKNSPLSERSNKQNGNVFKIPSIPTKKICTPGQKPFNSHFKNVVSPVAVYINNSPKYHPMAKIKATGQCQNIELITPVYLKPQSLIEIPMAIYKPSKIQHVQQHKGVHLPQSIKSLIKTPTHIKHTCRITKTARSEESIARKLEESIFLADNSIDISVLNIKEGYKL